MAKFFWPIDVRINGVPLYSNIAFSANCMTFVLSDGSRVGYLGVVFTEN